MTSDSDVTAQSRSGAEPSPDSRPVRIVIADDHALYRRSLRIVLSLDRDLVVIGEASNGREAVDACHALRPDVLVMDVQMPRLGGLAVLEELSDEFPDMKVLMLTMSEDQGDFLAALRAGVSGYLLKDTPGETVAENIHRVHAGGIAVSESVLAALLGHLSSMDPSDFVDPEVPRLVEQLRHIVHRVGTRTPEEAAADRSGGNPEFAGKVRALLDEFRALPVPARDTVRT